MTIYIELDFETRSLADLKVVGAERYSEDVSTEIICLCYTVNDQSYDWTPWSDQEIWRRLAALAMNPDAIFVAHNAAFEQAIWRNQMVAVHGFPPIPIERWDCSLASCAWKGYPLALDKGARAMRLPADKDMEGNKLTLGLSKLQGVTAKGKLVVATMEQLEKNPAKEASSVTGWNLPEITPQIRQRVIQYCAQDVVVERGVIGRVGLISQQSKAERSIWILDQTINQRGVRLDMAFVTAAQSIVDKETARLLPEFYGLTGLSKLGSPRLKDWCVANGLPVENLQKGYLAQLLGSDEDDTDPTAGYTSLAGDDDVYMLGERVPENVRRVLEIRRMLGGAAVKKLKRMRACVGYDGRARGLLQYHAAHSGRWGGRLLQPQNFPRETTGLDPEEAVRAILTGDPRVVEGATGLGALDAVARCLRHALVPDDGKIFLVGDYAQIEARVVLALAGQMDKVALLASGYPVYFDVAEQIYNQPKGSWAVTDEKQLKANKAQFLQQYTIGKNTVLGCGFQMGGDTFHHRYCPDQPIEFAEDVVETYRKEWAPKVPFVWYAQDRESFKAMTEGGRREAYGVIWEAKDGWMTASLPSGWQKIWYPQPYIGTGRFGDPCWKSWQSKQGKWIPVDMYGGLETENVVQALARAIMCHAMAALERAGFPIVLTIHDEIACEVPKNSVDMDRFESIMRLEESADTTKWVRDMGIPIAIETGQGPRYRKW